MNILNLFKVSIRAVANNKMRSFLSMLGIIIGVAAVIIMMSIGQGSKESIRAELSTMGTNLINIRPGADMRGGVRQDPSSMQTLKMADYERIMREKKYVTNVSPEVTASGQAIYGNSNTNTTVYGESPEYLDIKQWTIEQGDCFTQEDIKKAAKVCVVGTTIVKELYGEGADVIGKTIRFKSIPMRIIGVLKSKGYNNWGMDQDNVIIAPNSTVMKRIAAQTWFSSIVCSAITEELSDAAIEELTQILRDNHKLKGDAADDFTIRSQAEMMETMSSTMDTVTIILVVAAAFSLLVAGIGIMNIMLVSVTERTKEIGLRMAVGATGPVISLQFLIESVLISVTGGLLGILVGCSASEFIVPMFNMPSSVPAWSIYVSFFVCVCIGVLFGYIPAQKAANMDPIEAIRHE
ncbi:multidrug ABC transporter substrate-binding protein [Prevotella sp. P5-126]|uniref:ABC transporter permease n=1 Tax=Prevotella sp. P5-126 TaxID=2024216 RepID=UPI000B971789|nr:ABC transporter permease [Prevotella sp. P5-126]OYP35411.1 multidrug ABC transporter substrate-binding protein [Prevotella sp. P5-126]